MLDLLNCAPMALSDGGCALLGASPVDWLLGSPVIGAAVFAAIGVIAALWLNSVGKAKAAGGALVAGLTLAVASYVLAGLIETPSEAVERLSGEFLDAMISEDVSPMPMVGNSFVFAAGGELLSGEGVGLMERAADAVPRLVNEASHGVQGVEMASNELGTAKIRIRASSSLGSGTLVGALTWQEFADGWRLIRFEATTVNGIPLTPGMVMQGIR